MTHNPIRPWRNIDRRVSRQIRVGKVLVGGDAPISVQTMTNTLTTDVAATLEQICSGPVSASPTTPTAAFALGARTEDPLAMYLCDTYTIPSNLTGDPAMWSHDRIHGSSLGHARIAAGMCELLGLPAAQLVDPKKLKPGVAETATMLRVCAVENACWISVSV